MEKKILIISYIFPPIAYGGTFRSLRFTKYLSLLGYKISVLTINIQNDLHNDFDLLKSVPANVDIYRTGTIDFWRMYQKIKLSLLKTLPGRVINNAACFLLSIVNQPDHMIFWTPFAILKARSIIKQNNISVIYTTSPPHSVHIIGFILKRMCPVKWIADFRDPIIGNIVSSNWNWYERKINFFLEKLIFTYSNHIVVNTEYMCKQLMKRYPSSSVEAIRNSFDPDDYKNQQLKHDIFTVAHIGSMYAFRKIDILLEGLHKLAIKAEVNPDNFIVRFVGLTDASIKNKVQHSEARDLISIENAVNHSEAIQLMEEADLLLLIKGFGDNSAGQIPGKLFEYIGTGNKIIYIGPEDSEAAEIIRELKRGYIVGDDPDKLAAALEDEYHDYIRNGRRPADSLKHDDPSIAQFSSPVMSEKLHRIIQIL